MATAYDIAMKHTEPEENDGAPVVAVEDVRKTYASHTVLDGIN